MCRQHNIVSVHGAVLVTVAVIVPGIKLVLYFKSNLFIHIIH